MRKLVSLVLAGMMLTTMSVGVFARDTALPDKIYSTESFYGIEVTTSGTDASKDKVYYMTDGKRIEAGYSSATNSFSIPPNIKEYFYESGSTKIKLSTDNIIYKFPGMDGKWYLEGGDSKAVITVTKGTPVAGFIESDTGIKEYSVTSSNGEYKAEMLLNKNGAYTIGVKFNVTADDGKNKVDHFVQHKIKCSRFDSTIPTIGWECADIGKKLELNTESIIQFKPADTESYIFDFTVKDVASGSVVSLTAPYKYSVRKNSQLQIEATNTVGQKANLEIAVTWFANDTVTDPTNPVNPLPPPVVVDPSNPDHTDHPDKTNNQSNVKLYTNTSMDGYKVSSLWDNYWNSAPEVKEEVTLAEEKKQDTKKDQLKKKKPTTPSGYVYVYRQEKTQASPEVIKNEIDSIVSDLSKNGIEVNPEELAITADVTLNETATVVEAEEKNSPKMAVILAVIVIGLATVLCMIFILIKSMDIFKN